ncbi:MAG: hypothetical protein JM58_09210 [Peptococcaceae bacterium BICA1-8]|nr:MAG: hypothetical protein JM58_09210 [Peptococcaceae bacterium BICA1-8]
MFLYLNISKNDNEQIIYRKIDLHLNRNKKLTEYEKAIIKEKIQAFIKYKEAELEKKRSGNKHESTPKSI